MADSCENKNDFAMVLGIILFMYENVILTLFTTVFGIYHFVNCELWIANIINSYNQQISLAFNLKSCVFFYIWNELIGANWRLLFRSVNAKSECKLFCYDEIAKIPLKIKWQVLKCAKKKWAKKKTKKIVMIVFSLNKIFVCFENCHFANLFKWRFVYFNESSWFGYGFLRILFFLFVRFHFNVYPLISKYIIAEC